MRRTRIRFASQSTSRQRSAKSQRFHLAALDAADGDLAKARQQSEVEDLAVVGQSGGLATELLELAQHQLGRGGEGDLVSGLGWSVAEHHPAKLGLGFELREALAGSPLALQADAAVQASRSDIPASVPELASVGARLDVQGADAVAATAWHEGWRWWAG